MSITINQIELKNWFNYKGDYSNNVIKFSEGFNLFVADNNGGKTKLHNAFRWLLKDKVIINENNKPIESSISNHYLNKIINHDVARNVNINENVSFGVSIIFTKKNSFTDERYKLTKEYEIQKVKPSSFSILNKLKEVLLIDKITNHPRRINKPFEEVVKYIMPNNFLSYFLIEGEQLGSLTPLEGDELKTTINSIVSLNVLDETVEKAKTLYKDANKMYQKALKADASFDEEKKTFVELIDSSNKNLEKLNNLLKEEINKKETANKIIQEYKQKAEESSNRKKIYKKWEELNNKLIQLEEEKNQLQLRFLSEFTNKHVFSLSKSFDLQGFFEKLNQNEESIRTFVSKRRTELDSSLSVEEQDMIMLLERSQPKPEILSQMLDRHHCFVCNHPLDEASENYIRYKLIPFFKNETENDPVLSRMIDLHDLFKNVSISFKNFVKSSDDYYKQFKIELEDVTQRIIEANNNLEDFIEEYGKPSDQSEEEAVALSTYTTAVENKSDAERNIEKFQNEIESTKRTISNYENKINSDGISTSSKKAEDLKQFSTHLLNSLTDLKRKQYHDFARDLENKATSKYQYLMKYTNGSKNKVRVDVIENDFGDFEFAIKIIDKNGEDQSQAGGADQALRRVSVIFALVEMSENNNGYPFIADAPVSSLSPDNKKEFFNLLLEESAIKQSIVMSMDLVASEKSKNEDRLVLNELGEEVLKKVRQKNNSSLISIWNNKISYLKS